MESSQNVLFEASDGVAIITLNRPAKRNAIDAQMSSALREAFDRVERDGEIQVSVLAANGPDFCAGMDLKAFMSGDGDKILFGEHGFAGFVKRAREKPVIAAVEGAAFAGGFEIMLACDLAIASEQSRFALPEPAIGLVAAGGGALRLAQYMPRVRANEILLTGRPFSAQEALDWGLLNSVVPANEVLAAAKTLAEKIAQNAPRSTRASLRLSNAAFRQLEVSIWPENDRLISEGGASADAREGISAFFEKRQPVWRGE